MADLNLFRFESASENFWTDLDRPLLSFYPMGSYTLLSSLLIFLFSGVVFYMYKGIGFSFSAVS